MFFFFFKGGGYLMLFELYQFHRVPSTKPLWRPSHTSLFGGWPDLS